MTSEGMKRISPRPGVHVADAAESACEYAKDMQQSYLMGFNGLDLTVTPDSTKESVVAEYERLSAERGVAYWTPERLQQKATEEERQLAEARVVMAELPALDTSNLDACIRWLCRLETVATTHSAEALRALRILQHFAAGGLVPSMNVSMPGEAPEAWAARVGLDGRKRWLIGQALDGVERMGAPHQVIHHFAQTLGVR